MEPVKFDWDKGNINKNLQKHNVTDKESEEAFFDSRLRVYYDKGHSKKEERYYALGKTLKGQILFIVFTIRNDRIRIISARDINKKEKMEYEKTKENTRV